MVMRLSGKRYAEAAFELAVERGTLEQWNTDMQMVSQVLQDEEYQMFLKHAEVPLENKLNSINTVFREVDPTVRNLVSLLVTKGRVNLIPSVQDQYGRLLDAHLGRQRVEVTSAVPLDDSELERIRRFVTELIEQEVVISTKVDESILGGVIIQVGDRLLDGSTRTKLEELRKRVQIEAAQSGSQFDT